MAVIRKRGKVKTVPFPVTTSTAFTRDTFVKLTSGLIAPATSGDDSGTTIGVIRQTIAATDADYATARTVEIEVPLEKHVEYEIDVNAGLLSTDLGTEYDLAGAGTIDHSATTDKVAKCIKYISATKGWFWFKFNGSY